MGAAQTQIQYVIEQDDHHHKIEQLLTLAFGPGRFAKTAERLREGNQPIGGMCFVAQDCDRIVASVRFWPIQIGTEQALLLGPLAVDPSRRGSGIGIGLMETALEEGRKLGHGCVILVGDEPYYARVGFAKTQSQSITLPGPVDPERLLWLDLKGSKQQPVSGVVSVPHDTSP